MIKEYNILISSVGGQGGVTLAQIVSGAALKQGLKVLVCETLGMAQRGGAVQSHIRIGEDVYGPLIPESSSDVLLALEPAEALRVAKYIGKKTRIILNTFPSLPISVMLNQTKYPKIEQIVSILEKLGGSVYPLDAMEVAEKAGSSRSLNIVVLGAYMSLQEPILTLDGIKESMAEALPQRYLELNNKALEMGMEKMKGIMKKAQR